MKLTSITASFTPHSYIKLNAWINQVRLDSYINGDTWDGAESIPEEFAFNQNRFIYIPDVNTTLDAGCFCGSEACSPPAEIDINFLVDMSNGTVSGDAIHLAGSFNQWDPTVMPLS